MIPLLRDILGLLEAVAPEHLAEPWDNPGMQVGDADQKVHKILFALDPTKEALDSAFANGAQLLLTHHPLIFEPLARVNVHTFPGNIIIKAAEGGVSVVSAHTNLDIARGGLNDILAGLFKLQHVEALKQTGKETGVGLGRVGNLSKKLKLSAFSNTVKRVLKVADIKVLGHGDTQISRVAVIGGSGGSMVSAAVQKGADLLLTGDIGHHHALTAETYGMALIDGGHFSTEKTAFAIFAERFMGIVKKKGWQVSADVYQEESDPLRDDWDQ